MRSKGPEILHYEIGVVGNEASQKAKERYHTVLQIAQDGYNAAVAQAEKEFRNFERIALETYQYDLAAAGLPLSAGAIQDAERIDETMRNEIAEASCSFSLDMARNLHHMNCAVKGVWSMALLVAIDTNGNVTVDIDKEHYEVTPMYKEQSKETKEC